MKKTKKYFWRTPFSILLLCVCLLAGCSEQTPEGFRFKFNESGKFKIAQFTDIHWIHGAPTSARTIESIKTMLAIEKPDIAILTGDLVYKLHNREPWTELAAIFEEAKTPFAVALGNHDAEGGTKITRSEIFDILSQSPFFVGEKGPEDIQGVGNYVLPVYNRKNKVAALLYCFDSNAYSTNPKVSGYDAIHFDQITWYREQSAKYTAANHGKPLPSLAFFHIPLPEYWVIVGRPDIVGIRNMASSRYGKGDWAENGKAMSNFVGIHREDPAPPDYNTGLFHSFLDMQDMIGVFVGHDHVNDFIGILEKVALAYGRVSGWEAYGNLERGARIIELHENEFEFDTWISTPKGIEQIFHYPTGISSVDEENMTYLPAKQVNPAKQGVTYKYYEGCRSLKDVNESKLVNKGVMKKISIAEAPSEDHFAYEFRCLMQIPERGVYNFYTVSDDDSQIYIDDVLVVDKFWSNISRLNGKVALEAGFHEVKVRYCEDSWGQSLEVGYSSKKMRDRNLNEEKLYVISD